MPAANTDNQLEQVNVIINEGVIHRY